MAIRGATWPCGGLRERERLVTDISATWSQRDDTVVCVSVRAAFDLLLAALALPPGSEVLFVPGINIPIMSEIAKRHQLQVRGTSPSSSIDLMPTSLVDHLSESTRVVVIAHLFGAVHDISSIVKEAQERNVFVFEDCAEAFVAPSVDHEGFRGHVESDAAFVSFGVIKTLTAFGGAVGHVRDAALRSRMRAIEGTYPVRPSAQFRSMWRRVVYWKFCSCPVIFGLFVMGYHVLGWDYTKGVIRTLVRSQPADIRFRPALPLLRFLSYRLKHKHVASLSSNCSWLAARKALGESLTRRLCASGIEILGGCGHHNLVTHSWWLVPALCDNPSAVVQGLVLHGFDATDLATSLCAVHTENSKPATVELLMSRVVYLPLSPALWPSVERLAEAVTQVYHGRDGRDTNAGKVNQAAHHVEGAWSAACVLFLGTVAVVFPESTVLALGDIFFHSFCMCILAVAFFLFFERTCPAL